MKIISERLYSKLPVALQNVVVSLYGLREHTIRYQGIYKQFEKSIEKNVSFSEECQLNFQEQQLRKVLTIAQRHVPYYNELFKKNNVPDVESFKIENLKYIPLLEKQKIRENPKEFLNNTFDSGKLITLNTTGTTGTPLKIKCTPEARQKNYAFFNRFLKSVGINPFDTRATFGGRLIVDYSTINPPFWRYSLFQKNLMFSSFHLTDSNIESYITALQEYKPSLIDSYPSSIYAIADFAQRKGISLSGITRGIVTSSETLPQHKRSVIENTFGVPVNDQYGAVEMCIFIGQCREGLYHIHSDYSIVEIIKEDGCYAEQGEEGEVVCTGFINTAMPLIRYRLGDCVIPSSKKCQCGSMFPVIEKIVGRTDDVIITPEGRKVGRLSPVLKGFPIHEAQYVQESVDNVTLNIIKGTNYTPGTDALVIDELRKRLGQKMKISINHVDSIKRGKGGKYRTVISNVKTLNHET
jgi:phenylacetate-CoA ligase